MLGSYCWCGGFNAGANSGWRARGESEAVEVVVASAKCRLRKLETGVAEKLHR